MATLQYVGIDTSLYTSQYAVQSDPQDSDEDRPPDDCDDKLIQFHDGVDVTPSDSEPLIFFYDCETAEGSYHHDHIIEIAATVIVSVGLHISISQFSSLCHTSHHIAQKGNKHTTCACNAPFSFYQCQNNVGSHHTCDIINQCFPLYSKNC